MAIIPTKNRTTGLDPFFNWPRDFDSFFSNALENIGYGKNFSMQNFEKFTPRLDVSETENEYRVKMEVPGMTEKDLDLTFQDNSLIVRGEKREEETNEKENFHFRETRYGSFTRAIPFASNVDEDKIKAEFENGILKVSLSKSKDSIDKTRKIKIN